MFTADIGYMTDIEAGRGGILVAGQQVHEGQRVSDVLTRLFSGDPEGRVSVDDIRGALEDRAFGFLILVLALPNMFPGPPGVSGVLGTPIILLALQMAAGMRRPWLPRFILRRNFRRGDLAGVVNKSIPWVRKVERWLRPRLPWLNAPPFDRLVGLLMVVFAFLLALPIPLANPPLALALMIVALGLIEQDGYAIGIGIVTGILGSLWAIAITIVSWHAVVASFDWVLELFR